MFDCFYRMVFSFLFQAKDMRKRGFEEGTSPEGEAPKPIQTINPLTGKEFSSNYYALQRKRRVLPVADSSCKELFFKHIQQYQILLLMGETGSGKTTQIPQFLAEMNPVGRIVCTQPRRLAAIAVAVRVAEEMDIRIGDEVGYCVRFESRISDKTKILYETEGMLLREAMNDPLLTKYSVIVVDEAHERSVDTDLLLGVVKNIARHRMDLRVVVMSATLDVSKFQQYFPGAPLMKIPGRLYDVSTFYTQEPVKDYVEAAIEHAFTVHCEQPPGDILVFLIGESEIEKAVHRLQLRLERELDEGRHVMKAKVLPLHGSLQLEDQRRVFQPTPPDTRKIVFATNIAETSLTIDGIVYVIDSGFVKQRLYNAEARVDCLLPTEISKAAAEQRAGRAGRTKPGKCFRLFRQADFKTLPDQTYPEIVRSNLTDIVLTMLKLGIQNIVKFDYLDAPAPSCLVDAMTQLSYLGAVDEHVCLTDFGKNMGEYPVDAQTARMIMMAGPRGCSVDIAIIAAMMNVPRVFLTPQRTRGEAEQRHSAFIHPEGDLLTLFNVFRAFIAAHKSSSFCRDHFIQFRSLDQADRIFQQLASIIERQNIGFASVFNDATNTINSELIRRVIFEGFFTNTAFSAAAGVKYMTVRERQVASLPHGHMLSKGSHKNWVTYQMLEIRGKEGTVMKNVTPVDPTWFQSTSSAFFAPSEIEDPDIAAEVMKYVSEE